MRAIDLIQYTDWYLLISLIFAVASFIAKSYEDVLDIALSVVLSALMGLVWPAYLLRRILVRYI